MAAAEARANRAEQRLAAVEAEHARLGALRARDDQAIREHLAMHHMERLDLEISTVTLAARRSKLLRETSWAERLARIRAAGWVVACHNDYRLGGAAHTFWLFTKGDRAAAS